MILNHCLAIHSNTLYKNTYVLSICLYSYYHPPVARPQLDKDERSDEESEEEEEEEEEGEQEKEGEEEEGAEYCWEKRSNALNSKFTMLTHSCVLNNLNNHRTNAVDRSHKTQ